MRKLILIAALAGALPAAPTAFAQAANPSTMPASTSGPVDCDNGLAEIQSRLDRGRQLAASRQWAEALPLLRDAQSTLSQLLPACPNQQKWGQEMEARLYPLIQQGELAHSHQTTCQPRLDEALEHDLKVGTARRQNKEPKDLEPLYAQAEQAWRSASESCQSPYRERAEKSLNAIIKTRGENAEQLSAGPACDNAWKNAGTIADLARDAWKGKRWDEAADLYGKSHLAWERASEHCQGSRQQTAQKRADQAQLDAHNAEYCGPQWDEASELAQQMKARAATTAMAEREQMSIRTEVAWRDAATLCRGAPQSLARNNADALVRERGAPLPPGSMEKYGKQPQTPVFAETSRSPASTAPAAQKNSEPQVRNTVTAAPASNPGPAGSSLPVKAVTPVVQTAAAVTTPVAVAGNGASVAGAQAIEHLVVGDTTFRGNFSMDGNTGLISGEGTVSWRNGDRYTGQVSNGKRQGKGRFTWANGQWYDGEWRNDIATGKGSIGFTSGDRYEGDVVEGTPHGQGTMNFASGDRYSGQLHKGIFNGQGTYTWKSGSHYDGAWVMGKKQGKGRLTMTDGSGWEGEFENDDEGPNGQRFKAATRTASSR